jgi:hypothetical protein
MRIYVRTRGELRHHDYDFLGLAPAQPWWRDFGNVNTMERPCLLCVRDSRGLRVFLSGMPSSRVDTVGTLIVYSLVLEDPGKPGEPAAGAEPATSDSDAELAQRLIAAWTQAIPAHGADRTLSDALDEAFPIGFVESSLTARSEEAADEAEQRVRAILAKLPSVNPAEVTEPGPGASPPVPARWIAGIGQPSARAAFLSRTTAILDGEDGQAHVLNMVADGTQASDLLPASRTAVLMEGEYVGDPMAPITELPQRTVPKDQPVPAEPGSNVLGRNAVKVLAAIVCAGILAWVIYRVTGAGKLTAHGNPEP